MQLWNFVQGTQERVRISRGKRTISVRATEALLYLHVVIQTGPNEFLILFGLNMFYSFRKL